MSSIAYVTDQKMIEYHRLNGNKRINFWRPSSSIKFSDFKKDDLLFFLAKGTEKNKEKGLIGYGRFQHGEKLTPRQAWNKYTTSNGYSSKEELFEAIQKVNKQRILSKTIGCLYLEDVVFFQAPVYLSEIGVKISKRLESYAYLDKDDVTITVKILEQAKEVGIDAWASALHVKQEDSMLLFEEDQAREIIANAHTLLHKGNVSEKPQTKFHKFASEAFLMLKEEGHDVSFIKGSITEFFHINESELQIYVPLYFYTKHQTTKLIEVIGRLKAYESILAIDMHIKVAIKLIVYCNQSLVDGFEDILKYQSIEVIEIKKNAL